MVELRVSNEPTPNFHQAVIAYPDRSVAVVCVRDAKWPRISGHDLRYWWPDTFGEGLFNYWG